ncbi:glycoside hydrolase family 76 protein [Didymella exigua CBS 183.55]|uniref:mannan endo-1,6-alpha-mannosidase n=1 Tax=Didymella exigua CBS 183.55 TaxID=1150837 RepID=A0A6A5R8C6_9PLEO|nr:glycoside hydrolase family 76 protein [Didymella exigua CBS 183.55]KAF1923470.1 glycoside hydrolase family 76 protein [Didymella exigua CBS 183.55]
MLPSSVFVSLVCSLGHAAALNLEINSQESIRSLAQVLASGVVSFYDEILKKDLIPGLFPPPYYWWESGLAFNALIDYYGLTNNFAYNARITEALQHQLGDSNAFMPANQTKTLCNDDQSTWGLASLSAYETQLPAPLTVARWDTGSCDGGLKWQISTFKNDYHYKNAFSSGQLFLLAARLADHTGNATYTEWANKVYNWTTEVGLVSVDYHVYDGTNDQTNCLTINHIQWSNNHAIYMEGAALMYKISNGSEAWTATVKDLVNSFSVFTDENGALREAACEGNGQCIIDQRAFKGIAAHSFSRAAQAAPIIADSIYKTLNASAKAAAASCESSGDEVACNLYWSSKNGDSPRTAAGGKLS